jgi:hypothetical protein
VWVTQPSCTMIVARSCLQQSWHKRRANAYSCASRTPVSQPLLHITINCCYVVVDGFRPTAANSPESKTSCRPSTFTYMCYVASEMIAAAGMVPRPFTAFSPEALLAQAWRVLLSWPAILLHTGLCALRCCSWQFLQQ